MGALLNKPKTDKYNEHGDWNGLRYGLSSMQGWRIEMEDAHCAVMGLPGQLKDWAFFAVFDGHAGERVSSHCADNLLETIIQTEQFSRSAVEEDVSIEEIKRGIRDVTNDLESICNQVIDTCLYKGSRDNMSMVLVTFPACPPPVEDAIQKEAALEAFLKQRVTELVEESGGAIELPHILQYLSDENIADLPPGGGLAAKRTFIESVYKTLCPNSAETPEN